MGNAKAVDLWYDEIKYTNGGLTSAFSSNTGHYTQVVWKDSTHLGCGIEGTLLVCQYGKAGNVMGQFDAQVKAPSRSEAECSSASVDGAAGSTSGASSSTASPRTSTGGSSGSSASNGGFSWGWPFSGSSSQPSS